MKKYMAICISIIISLTGCTDTTSKKMINDMLTSGLSSKYGEEFIITEEEIVDTGNIGVPGHKVGYKGKAITSNGEKFDAYYRLSDNKLLDTYAETLYSNSDIENEIKKILGGIKGFI